MTHCSSKRIQHSQAYDPLSISCPVLKRPDRFWSGVCDKNIYESVLSQIAALDLAAAEGARFRRLMFFRLKRRRGTDGWISAMWHEDGTISSEIKGICVWWVSACPTYPLILDKLLDELSSSLEPDQVPVCEGYLSTQKVYEALGGMATRKSPDSDALPAEFYVAF